MELVGVLFSMCAPFPFEVLGHFLFFAPLGFAEKFLPTPEKARRPSTLGLY